MVFYCATFVAEAAVVVVVAAAIAVLVGGGGGVDCSDRDLYCFALFDFDATIIDVSIFPYGHRSVNNMIYMINLVSLNRIHAYQLYLLD